MTGAMETGRQTPTVTRPPFQEAHICVQQESWAVGGEECGYSGLLVSFAYMGGESEGEDLRGVQHRI